MLPEERRRRNRRRVVLLALVAGINYWVIVTLIVFVACFYLMALVTIAHWHPCMVVAIVVSTIGVPLGVFDSVGSADETTVQALRARILDESVSTVAEVPKAKVVLDLVEELAIATGTPAVQVAYLGDPVPNALTVGASPKRSTIVVTKGLLHELTRDEIEAVLAVQVSEIARLDVSLRTFVVSCARGSNAVFDAFVGGWRMPANWIYLIFIWPTMAVGNVIQKLAYRNADYGADAMAVSTTRNPEALLRALEKLLADPGTVRAVTRENAALWFEPVPDTGSGTSRHVLLSRYSMTPSLEARIERLGLTV